MLRAFFGAYQPFALSSQLYARQFATGSQWMWSVSTRVHGYSFITVSFRLRIRLVTVVYAASSPTSSRVSRGCSPLLTYFRAASVLALNDSRFCANASSRISISVSFARRAVSTRNAYATRSRGVAPPSVITRSANTLAASTYATSFIRSSACRGVLVTTGLTMWLSRADASKFAIDGGGTERRQNVYRLRRYRLSP